MKLTDLPASAKLYLRPTGFGSGIPIAGGYARFSAIEVSARVGTAVDYCATFTLADFDGVGAALAPPMRDRFDALFRRLITARTEIAIGDGVLRFDHPNVMGILNVTPDSFSDGGKHDDPMQAAAAGIEMIRAGAAVVDIGGESTRPGSEPVPLAVELARLDPVLRAYQGHGALLSIDTRKSAVMRHALGLGACLINDVSALTHDTGALAEVARYNAPVVLMHAQGTPQSMQLAPHYDDCLRDVFDWLEARIAVAVAGGIDRARIIVDPGIGFGKTVAHNLELLRGLGMLHGLGCPILLGVSRKKMIGVLSGDVAAHDRLGGSLALALAGLDQGVQLLRVHDVPATVQALRLWEAMRG